MKWGWNAKLFSVTELVTTETRAENCILTLEAVYLCKIFPLITTK